MNAIKTKIALMTATQRRNLVVGGAAAVGIVVAGAWLATRDNSPVTVAKPQRPVKYSPLTGKANDESSLEALNAKLKVMQDSINESNYKQKQLENMLAQKTPKQYQGANTAYEHPEGQEWSEGTPAGGAEAFIPPELRNYAANKSPRKAINSELSAGPRNPAIDSGSGRGASSVKQVKQDTPSESPKVIGNNGEDMTNRSHAEEAPAVPEAQPIRLTSSKEEGRPTNWNAQNEQKVVRLPAGTMLSGVLINGMDAPTGVGTMRQPVPALIRVKDLAILPNGFRVDLRECMIISAGYGSLGSEKAYIRSENLSCVRNDGSVLESQLDAYASGPDGKTGIPGHLVSKTGQLISQSLAAGAFGGMATASKSFRPPVLQVGGANGQSVDYGVTAQQALYDSMLGGLGAAASKVSDYFLEMLKESTPVVEILPGTRIDFIVQRPMSMTSAPLMSKESVAKKFDSILGKARKEMGDASSRLAQASNPQSGRILPNSLP